MQTQTRALSHTRPNLTSMSQQTTGYKMTDVFANLFHTFTKLKDIRTGRD